MSNSDAKLLEGIDDYKYGFRTEDVHVFQAPRKGVDREIVEQISAIKNEPDWMLQFRLKALEHFENRPMPAWGGDLSKLNLDDIYFYTKPTEEEGRTWDDVPETIKDTFDKLGIPEAEQKFLAGVGAQYESEMVYHSIKEHLAEQGVIFKSIEQGLQDHEELFREYFGTVIPIEDNKFSALNSAVWSGGSFVYVPPGVTVDMPLQAYFRINTADMGQFERTLIIIDEGAQAHYVEGCTAPIYSSDSFHSGVIEIVVKKGARMRYSTIQNWSTNMYNLVTQRALVDESATMEWVDANLGCLQEGSTVTTPGGIKAIEDLEIGEQVLSFDEEAGELCFRPVLAKQFSGYQRVREVSVGERSLFATDNHPFYSFRYDPTRAKGSGRYTLDYVRADELTAVILPRTSIPYGVPQRVGLPEVATTFRTKNRYSDNLEVARARDRRLRVAETATDNLLRQITLPPAVEIRKVTVSEPSKEKVPTWDIEVAGTGNFIAEGFIVHNSKLTMKYPSCYLLGEGAHGEILSLAFASGHQHQDTGGKIIHVAPNTSSVITSKSISKNGGRASYRGLLKVHPDAEGSTSNVVCDALLLDERSRSDTYPYIEIDAQDVTIGHEASVSKVGEEQLFYLMSRGLTEEEATTMVVAGFIEPLVKELPMEYAVEMNRLIQLQMEGSIG